MNGQVAYGWDEASQGEKTNSMYKGISGRSSLICLEHKAGGVKVESERLEGPDYGKPCNHMEKNLDFILQQKEIPEI